jgi:hypothetical protein
MTICDDDGEDDNVGLFSRRFVATNKRDTFSEIMISLGGPLAALLLASSRSNSNNMNPFQDERLASGYELFLEAELLAKEGSYQEAADVYVQGILMGRPIVLALQEKQQQLSNNKKDDDNNDEDHEDDDPQQALDWLIFSHVQSSMARLQFQDIHGARGNAWAACTFSQNTHLPSLQCMLKVCEVSNDILNELQTLKAILQLLSSSSSSPVSASEDENIKPSRQEMALRVASIKQELEKKTSK